VGDRVLTLPRLLSRYRGAIERALRELLSERELPFYRLLRYHLGFADQTGTQEGGYLGKALRPSLLLLTYEALAPNTDTEARPPQGGPRWQAALPAAVALELVHSFSLVHDDIQDQDEERHGRPTVWRLWGAGQAINVGDGLRELAGLALLKLEERFPPEVVLQAAGILGRATLEMIEGQYLDLDYEGRWEITVQDYLAMVRRKTGALMGAAFELGALLAGSEPERIRTLGECGRALGVSFQIRDDILGIWGEPDKTGKPALSDLFRWKKSLPIVYAASSQGEGERLRRIYLDPDSGERERAARAQAVLEVLEGVSAREWAQAQADSYLERALTGLRAAGLPSWALELMEELGAFLRVRDH